MQARQRVKVDGIVTVIAGLVHRSEVYIGGDCAGLSGWDLTHRSDEKVFTRRLADDRWAFGFTTSFRMGQLLRYALELPPLPADDRALLEFMATSFVDAVRKALKAGGWAKTKDDQEQGGAFLVGVRGRLFEVESDYQVGEPAAGYEAIGWGAGPALGALHATATLRWPPRKRIRAALTAAEHHNAGVRGPFVIEKAG